jgi:2,4-dienoyl-CoA reductase-like NADH-dependent reductase (Old Yellow Enzyme family)
MNLKQPLTLPCGAVLPNRIAKAAMTEGLADPSGRPTVALERLYSLWSDGGAGLLLSGNVQVDGDHLERPGNVIIDRQPDDETMTALQRWTSAARRNGNHFWAQISHAGRQTMKASSAVKLGLPGGQFGTPTELSEEEILSLIGRFGQAARVAKEGGFTGVQIHAAHGYLISQFLSPRSNQRGDRWGGTLGNRARFLLFTVNTVRQLVGLDFPVSVKLNSADFQRGGFAFEESLAVASWLQDAGVDLLEISGGTYEQPKMADIAGMEDVEEQAVAPSTLAREAYFVDFAKAMKETVSTPLMLTGGFRTRSAMEQAIKSGAADVVGLGRPLCVMPDAPKRLMQVTNILPRTEKELALFPDWLAFLRRFDLMRGLEGFGVQYWYYAQIYALGKTGRAEPGKPVFAAMREVEACQKQWLRERKTKTAT